MFVGVLLENNPDYFCLIRDNDRRLAPLCNPVSQRRPGLIASPLGLLPHSPGNFPGEPDGVVFVHPFNDALDQAAEGTVHKRLGDADHVYIMLLFQQRLVDNAFFLVPGKPAELPDKDAVHRMLRRLGLGDHLLKLWPLLSLPAGDADLIEDLQDNDAVLVCIFLEELCLGIR